MKLATSFPELFRRRSCPLVGGKSLGTRLCDLANVTHLEAEFFSSVSLSLLVLRSDEGLTLKTSAFEGFPATNLHH